MASLFPVEGPVYPAAPDLQIFLLGPPRVVWAGSALNIPRRQTRAVLYRLAARLQPVPREQLCYLFWPDTPEATARRSLSRLLTHLRRTLPDPEMLLTAADQVGLDPRRVVSDTVAFIRALEQPGGSLQPAVDFYRGPFLDGFSMPDSPEFEMWAGFERETLQRSYLEALVELIEARTVQGEYEAAILLARRYLAVDDLAEDVHRRLIELYAATGDQSAALRQFEHCSQVLVRELGVGPLPETRSAYRSVLEGRAQVRRRARPAPTWTTLPSLEAPLVGRDEALDALRAAYAGVRRGQGRLVLISGEAGIGKSRLMQDFVSEAAAEATVLVGGGRETETGLPYWPLIEALRSGLEAVDWSSISVEPLYLAELACLMPELQTVLPRLPAPLPADVGHGRSRVFRALESCLLGLGDPASPLVLCIDDLHWADKVTLSWLGYLARQLKQAPVLVLGTYRTEDAPAVSALRAELSRLDMLHEVALAGLSPDDVWRLVRYLVGQSSGARRFSQRLHRETDGNPFFLLETLRALFEAGMLRPDGGGRGADLDETAAAFHELPLPDTVCEAIEARFRSLSGLARQVLEVGAVIGHRFDFDLIWAVSGRRQGEVVEALDELLGRQAIREQGGWYWFDHDLIRTVIYRDLSYGRRRLLHRRAGEALRKLRPGEVAALARHFERAEEPGQAAWYALQTGLEAKAIFAHAEARAYFDQALACLEQEAARLQAPEALIANRRLQVYVHAERGWVFRLLGDMEAYARDSQEVAHLAGLLGDQRTLAHLRWREAYTQRWFCRYPHALQAAEAGLELSQACADSLLEAKCWREVGLAVRELGDYERAQTALERALALFHEVGDVIGEVHTLGNMATLHWRRAAYDRAIELASRSLARCEATGLAFERRLPLGDLGAAAVAAGDVALAEDCLLESLAIARQIEDRTQEIFCLGHLGWLCLALERPSQAREFLGPALTLAENVDSGAEQSWLLSGLAEAYRLAGDLDLALEHVSRALELAQASGRAFDRKLADRILLRLA